MNPANLLTSLRLVLIPIIVYILLAEVGNYKLIAGFLFLISALTDFFDGIVARKLDIVTDLGRILDPIADKLTLIAIFITLLFKGVIPLPAGIIIIVRDASLFLASSILYLAGKDMIHPTTFGKSTAFILYVVAVINIFDVPWIGIPLIWVGAFLALLSALDYFRITIKKLRHPG